MNKPIRLTGCVMCGARKIARRRVTVDRGDGTSRTVVAEVCGACGEHYYDATAMDILSERTERRVRGTSKRSKRAA